MYKKEDIIFITPCMNMHNKYIAQIISMRVHIIIIIIMQGTLRLPLEYHPSFSQHMQGTLPVLYLPLLGHMLDTRVSSSDKNLGWKRDK